MESSLFLVFLLTIGTVFGAKSDMVCSRPADVVFVLDESASIWPSDFTKQLQFVQRAIETFNIEVNKIRIGVMTFATNSRIIFSLTDYTDEQSLKNAVKAIKQSPGNTFTHQALKLLRENMLSREKTRVNASHVAIIITDGKSSNTSETARQAQLCKDEGILMLAVGVGSAVVQSELDAIASASDLVFRVGNYSSLESIRQVLVGKACDAPTTPPPPTEAPEPPTEAPTPPPPTQETQPPTEAPATPPPPTQATQPPTKGPCSEKMDYIWAISDLAGVEERNLTLEFIKVVTGSITIDPNNIQVGLAKSFCEEGIPLKDHKSTDGLWKEIGNLPLKGLRTERTIEYIRQQAVISSNGGRSDAVKYGILIIDNRIKDWDKTLREAELAKSENIRLIVIGVGDRVQQDQLRQLAFSDEDYFFVENYDQLADLRIRLIQRLSQRICTRKTDQIWSISEQAVVDERNLALEFIKTLVGTITIDRNNFQVGLTPRFCEEDNGIQLKDHDTREGLLTALDNSRLKGLRTERTIEYIRQQGFSSSNGGRSDASKYGILIVDNRFENWEKTLREAQLAKRENIRLIVIGVGDRIQEDQLRQLAYSDEDYFFVENYGQLANVRIKLIQRLYQISGTPRGGGVVPNFKLREFFEQFERK